MKKIDRREQQKQIAINRAAHFAFTRTSSSHSSVSSVPTGIISNPNEKVSWPGPLATAKSILDKRKQNTTQLDDVSRSKQDEFKISEFDDLYDHITKVLRLEYRTKTFHGGSGTIKQRSIASLSQLCLKTIALNIQDYPDFDMLTPDVLVRLSEELSLYRALNCESARKLCAAFVESESITLSDCAQLDEKLFMELLQLYPYERSPPSLTSSSASQSNYLSPLPPAPLRLLHLKFCGHGFTNRISFHLMKRLKHYHHHSLSEQLHILLRSSTSSSSISSLIDVSTSIPSLESLSLIGLYNIKDQYLSQLISALAPLTLSSSSSSSSISSPPPTTTTTITTSMTKLSSSGSKLTVCLDSPLKHLNLTHCSSLSRLTLTAIASFLPNLISLSLDYASHLHDEHLVLLIGIDPRSNLKNNKNNNYQSSSSCSSSSSSSFSSSPLPSLTHLSLRSLIELTDQSFSILLPVLGPQLLSLNIRGCSRLTDGVLSSIRSYCTGLRSLDIGEMTFLSTSGLLALFLLTPIPPTEKECEEEEEEEEEGGILLESGVMVEDEVVEVVEEETAKEDEEEESHDKEGINIEKIHKNKRKISNSSNPITKKQHPSSSSSQSSSSSSPSISSSSASPSASSPMVGETYSPGLLYLEEVGLSGLSALTDEVVITLIQSSSSSSSLKEQSKNMILKESEEESNQYKHDIEDEEDEKEVKNKKEGEEEEVNSEVPLNSSSSSYSSSSSSFSPSQLKSRDSIGTGSPSRLRSLDLSSCSSLTNRTASAIIHHCTAHLSFLNLSFVRGISEEFFFEMISTLHSLQNIHVWGCFQLSNQFMNVVNMINAQSELEKIDPDHHPHLFTNQSLTPASPIDSFESINQQNRLQNSSSSFFSSSLINYSLSTSFSSATSSSSFSSSSFSSKKQTALASFLDDNDDEHGDQDETQNGLRFPFPLNTLSTPSLLLPIRPRIEVYGFTPKGKR